jgi:hypothetical protein
MNNEHSILAFFRTADDAQKAADQLQQAFKLSKENLQIDHVSAKPGDGNEKWFNPATGKIVSHATMIEGMDSISSRNVGVLHSSDPDIAGFADGQGKITGHNFLLTAIVPLNQLDQALNIINKFDVRH